MKDDMTRRAPVTGAGRQGGIGPAIVRVTGLLLTVDGGEELDNRSVTSSVARR
jgi:hypothetical protein